MVLNAEAIRSAGGPLHTSAEDVGELWFLRHIARTHRLIFLMSRNSTRHR